MNIELNIDIDKEVNKEIERKEALLFEEKGEKFADTIVQLSNGNREMKIKSVAVLRQCFYTTLGLKEALDVIEAAYDRWEVKNLHSPNAVGLV